MLPQANQANQANQAQSQDLKWTCQALSSTDESCDALASFQCGVCGQWFCNFHAENAAWHDCAREPGEQADDR